jgi:TonB family protein
MPFNYYAIGGTAMLFAILGLVFATISPVAALTSSGDDSATRAQSAGAATVAAACANPNADAKYTGGPPPELPHGLNATGSVIALLTIAPNGTVAHASISHSSGVAAIDRAVLTAAEHGTYAPKTIDCRAVQSDYLFRADFKPDKQ